MNNKSTTYVKEPTFLSPIDMHFRMMNGNNLLNQMPRLNIINNNSDSNNTSLDSKKGTYTLKRKK